MPGFPPPSNLTVYIFMILRRLFRRIVLWQPNTGFVVELPGRLVASNIFPEQQETTEPAVDGRRVLLERHSYADFSQIDSTRQEYINLMRQLYCHPVRAIMLGPANTKHVLWYEPSSLNGLEKGSAFGQFAGQGVRLDQHVVHPAIFQGTDLLFGIPWACTSAEEGGLGYFPYYGSSGSGSGEEGSGSGAVNYRLGTSHLLSYDGPFYVVSSLTPSVNASGVLTGDGEEVELVIEAPIGGARVRLETSDPAAIEFYDWSQGTLLTSAPNGVTRLVPYLTAYIRIVFFNASERPRLEIISPGKALASRDGVCVSCGTRTEEVPWEEPDDFPEEPPYWLCPTGVSCILLATNTCPYFCDGTYSPAALWTSGDSGLITGTLEEGDTPREGTLYVPESQDGLGRFAFNLCDPDGDDFSITAAQAYYASNDLPINTPGFINYSTRREDTIGGSGSGATQEREESYRVEFPYTSAPDDFYYIFQVDDGKDTCQIIINITKTEPGSGS